MSRWKRPHVSLKCPDCGQEFKALAETRFCPGCRYKPANRAPARARGKRKYEWTPERDQILRERYDSTVRGRVLEIAQSFGWPKWVITKRAQALGLATPWPADRRDWTPEELQLLLDHLGQRTVLWIAKRLKRSESSVVMKIKHLRLSRRIDDGNYTMQQVSEGFGVDHHVVDRWIRAGWLEARRSGLRGCYNDAYIITPAAVSRFIREHPTAYELRKVDQVWFLDLAGITGSATQRYIEEGVA